MSCFLAWKDVIFAANFHFPATEATGVCDGRLPCDCLMDGWLPVAALRKDLRFTRAVRVKRWKSCQLNFLTRFSTWRTRFIGFVRLATQVNRAAIIYFRVLMFVVYEELRGCSFTTLISLTEMYWNWKMVMCVVHCFASTGTTQINTTFKWC